MTDRDPTKQDQNDFKVAGTPNLSRADDCLFEHAMQAAKLVGTPIRTGDTVAYDAARQLFARTGRIDLVLEGLSLKPTVSREMSTVLRSAWVYLGIVFLIAAMGVAFFATFVSPTISAMRADMTLTPVTRVSPPWITDDGMYLFVATLAVLALGMLLAAATVRFSSAIVVRLGGRRYLQNRVLITIAHIQRALIANAMPPSEAREMASRIVGETGSPQSEPKEAAIWHAHASTQSLRFAADSRLSRLQIALPSLFIVVLGGTCALMYSMILFWPLISLIYDLSFIGFKGGNV